MPLCRLRSGARPNRGAVMDWAAWRRPIGSQPDPGRCPHSRGVCGCRGARARPAENGWALVRAAPRWRGPPWGFIKDKSPLRRDLGVRDTGDGWISGLALRRRTSRAGRGSYLWQARTTSNAARRRGLLVRSGSCNCPGKTALSCFRIKACAGRGRWRVLSGTGRFAHGRVDVLKAAPTQQEMGDFWRGAPWRYRSSSARD